MSGEQLAQALNEALARDGHLDTDEAQEHWAALLQMLEQETVAVVRCTYLSGNVAETQRLLANIHFSKLVQE